MESLGGNKTPFERARKCLVGVEVGRDFGAVFGFCVAFASPTRLLQDTWIRWIREMLVLVRSFYGHFHPS